MIYCNQLQKDNQQNKYLIFLSSKHELTTTYDQISDEYQSLVHEIGEPINRKNKPSYQGYCWFNLSCKSEVFMLKSPRRIDG